MQVEIVSFWICDFFQEVQSSILVVAISFLIVKTPLLCFTDVKLSSVQHHSVHTLISVIQRWSELVGESKDLVYNIQHKGRCLSSSNTSFLGWGFVWFRIERICYTSVTHWPLTISHANSICLTWLKVTLYLLIELNISRIFIVSFFYIYLEMSQNQWSHY